jgi:hypothetical protein
MLYRDPPTVGGRPGNCDPTCGRCYTNRRGRTNHKGHWGYRRPPRPRREFPMRFLPKSRPAANGSRPLVELPAPEGFEQFPAIWEHLYADQWGDGKERKPSTITLCVDGGALKLALNDRDGCRSLWVTGDGLESALGALEAHLREGDGQWRRWAQQKK